MRGPVLPMALICLLVTGGFLLGLNGCGGGGTTQSAPVVPSKIQHVVVIFQENRTPDNLFHDPVPVSYTHLDVYKRQLRR